MYIIHIQNWHHKPNPLPIRNDFKLFEYCHWPTHRIFKKKTFNRTGLPVSDCLQTISGIAKHHFVVSPEMTIKDADHDVWESEYQTETTSFRRKTISSDAM